MCGLKLQQTFRFLFFRNFKSNRTIKLDILTKILVFYLKKKNANFLFFQFRVRTVHSPVLSSIFNIMQRAKNGKAKCMEV